MAIEIPKNLDFGREPVGDKTSLALHTLAHNVLRTTGQGTLPRTNLSELNIFEFMRIQALPTLSRAIDSGQKGYVHIAADSHFAIFSFNGIGGEDQAYLAVVVKPSNGMAGYIYFGSGEIKSEDMLPLPEIFRFFLKTAQPSEIHPNTHSLKLILRDNPFVAGPQFIKILKTALAEM